MPLIQNYKWLFFDLNSYFASVEQNENPALRGKPVAIVPMQTDATCAIAASYEAKAYGIKTGTKIFEAKQMCPNLICVLARHDVYVQYHNRIIEEIIKHTPINKIWSIDELSSRLPPSKRNAEAAIKIAHNIKQGIWNNIGPALSCSIGVAPNTLLAKIAGDMQKPNGLTLLTQENLQDRLFKLRLTDLPGIGIAMERRLHRAGITSIEQLYNIAPKHARKIWGSVQGERFWYWLHGHDFEEPEVQRNYMIGHSRMLDPDLRSPEKARLMARRLLVKATARLRRKGYHAGVLSLSARTMDGRKYRREIRLSNPAQDPFTFLEHLETLWDEMLSGFLYSSLHGQGKFESVQSSLPLLDYTHKACNDEKTKNSPSLRFKKISVLLLSLRNASEITGDMLEEGYQDKIISLQKRESLAKALDALQSKYKAETVTLGTPPKTLAGYVGTKVAFSRVPDQNEFWE